MPAKAQSLRLCAAADFNGHGPHAADQKGKHLPKLLIFAVKIDFARFGPLMALPVIGTITAGLAQKNRVDSTSLC